MVPPNDGQYLKNRHVVLCEHGSTLSLTPEQFEYSGMQRSHPQLWPSLPILAEAIRHSYASPFEWVRDDVKTVPGCPTLAPDEECFAAMYHKDLMDRLRGMVLIKGDVYLLTFAPDAHEGIVEKMLFMTPIGHGPSINAQGILEGGEGPVPNGLYGAADWPYYFRANQVADPQKKLPGKLTLENVGKLTAHCNAFSPTDVDDAYTVSRLHLVTEELAKNSFRRTSL